MSNTATSKVIGTGLFSVDASRPLGQLVAAFILGTAIIYGAGFLNMSAAHNAAHDTRHSQGFPCH